MPADRDEVHSSSGRKGLLRVAIFGRLNSYNLYLETAFFSPEEIASRIHDYVPLPQYQRLFPFFVFVEETASCTTMCVDQKATNCEGCSDTNQVKKKILI